MTLPNIPKPKLPQENRGIEETRNNFCKLQRTIESKILKENLFLDKKILKLLDLKKYPSNSRSRNVRFKFVQQLHNAGIILFDSIKENDQLSNYNGSSHQNMILFSFINKFGKIIINKKNYINELQGHTTPTILNKISDNWNNYEEIDEWINKYKNCKKISK